MDGLTLGKIGKYELIEKLGQGSMGIVYLAYDPYNSRQVAIKVAIDNPNLDDEKRKKNQMLFFNEARITGMLDHPNILKVFDAGVDGNNYYIVMEYLKDAKTLKEYCNVGNLLPVEKVVKIIFQCCKALEYAHRLGVIHRDIKPNNIMITENDEVKLVDFGVAQIIATDETGTVISGFMGSPAYMSPEQIKEEPLTNQSDFFSLGIVMYELLTGVSPFYADKFSAVVRNILYKEPPPINFYRSNVPKTLEVVAMKALSKKLKERYHTAVEFANDLRFTNIDISRLENELLDKERFLVLSNLSFFKEFKDSEIWEVLRVVLWRQYESDKPIITEGILDDTFYVIVSGSALVKKDEKVLAALMAGDCFGEMGYLTKQKRVADVVAHSPVMLLEFNNAILEQMSAECQLRFHKVFLNRLIGRLSGDRDDLTDFINTH